MNATDVVFEILERNGPLPGESTEEKLNFFYIDAGHINSFGIVELVTELEDTFDIKFSSEHLQSIEFRKVGGLVSMIEQLRQKDE